MAVYTNNHLSVQYSISGEGFPVVLLHGFGEDAHVWHYQQQALAAHCRLIIPQLPGGEGSSPLEKEKEYTIDDIAEHIHGILTQEGIEHCILFGHSMGGYIALAFAEKYPGMLKGFGLVHSTAFADSEEKKQARTKNIAFIEAHGSHAFVKTTAPNLFGPRFKDEHAQQIENLVQSSITFDAVSLQQYTRAMMQRPDRTFVLKNSKVPVLFIAGTEDNAAPLKDVLQQTHLPEIAYIHVIEGAAHMGMWEAPQQVNNWLLEFIRNVA
jgi:pimeloyl-ACP methyl ester carboxylesterase